MIIKLILIKINFKPYENDDAIKKLYDLCKLVSPDKSLLVFSILMEAYGFKHFYGHDNSTIRRSSIRKH